MVKIAELNLDIQKTNILSNKTIILRQGDSTDTIKAYILLNGLPFTDIKSATFFAEKPDAKIIANDPANIGENNEISYPIPSELTSSQGNITEAYFLINGTSTTDSFKILVLKGVNLNGDSGDYIPGLSELDATLKEVNEDRIAKLNDMKAKIDGIDADAEVKKLIDAAIDEAKISYLVEYNKKIDAINSLLDNASDKEKALDTAIKSVNDATTNTTEFLEAVQKKIIDANGTFTDEQKAKVSKALSSLTDDIEATKKTADQLVTQVKDIKASVDSVNIPKIDADTQTALNNSKTALDNSNTAIDQASDTKKTIGNVPTGSTVMGEIDNHQKITSATLNGVAVPINNKVLTLSVPKTDLSSYATTASVERTLLSYPKTTDIDTQIGAKLTSYSTTVDADKRYAKTGDVPKNVLKQWQGTVDDFTAIKTKDNSTEYSVLNDDGTIKNIYVGNVEIYSRPNLIEPGTVLSETGMIWSESKKGFINSMKPSEGVIYGTTTAAFGSTLMATDQRKPLNVDDLNKGILVYVLVKANAGGNVGNGKYSVDFEYTFKGHHDKTDSSLLVFFISKEQLKISMEVKTNTLFSPIIESGHAGDVQIPEDSLSYKQTYSKGMEYKINSPLSYDFDTDSDSNLIKGFSIECDLPSMILGDGKTFVDFPSSLQISSITAI